MIITATMQKVNKAVKKNENNFGGHGSGNG